MCRFRECPFDPKIGSETNYEDSLSTLRNAVIRCIQQAEHHVVFQTPLPSCRVVALKVREMIHPRFTLLSHDFGMGNHQCKVLEVLCEGLPQQALYVFDQNSLRLQR